jgi:GAF domain-containing protein
MTLEPIDPRDALAQLVQTKPRETTLSTVFQRVVDFAERSMPEVTAASVTLVQGADAHTPACTDGLALTLDESQYELGHGPCLHAATAETIESISDMATESRWPDWTARALHAGARSSLSIGLATHEATGGALNLYSTAPHAFDDDAVAVARALAGYASLAMTSAHLRKTNETLSRDFSALMDSEIVIEQAKGIIIGDRRCTAEEAFATLKTMADESSHTVHDAAQAMVDRAAGNSGQ